MIRFQVFSIWSAQGTQTHRVEGVMTRDDSDGIKRAHGTMTIIGGRAGALPLRTGSASVPIQIFLNCFPEYEAVANGSSTAIVPVLLNRTGDLVSYDISMTGPPQFV